MYKVRIGIVFTFAAVVIHAFAGEEITRAAVERPGSGVLNWDTGANQSYLIPALEIPGFLTVLNLYDRQVYGTTVYGTTFKSAWDHVRKENWGTDDDPFNINQFSHPYQGATMFGFARSSGLGFWHSWFYSNVGSYMWKMAGETGVPSRGDMITTGQAGSLLGEALFRMSSLILENGHERPGFWRELGAAALLPPLAINRLAFGDRFKPIFPSHDPALFWRLRLGGSLTARVSDNSAGSTVKRREAIGDFEFAYGLPGKPDYTYDRPLDYFQFEFASLAGSHGENILENIMLRGLLWGRDYEIGESVAGIWGLYGNYVYIAPDIFRISSTALSVGSTAQWRILRDVALQGTALTGLGFGAAGTNHITGARDYHYGITPQGLIALRLIFGERAMIDLTGRAFYVSGTGSDDVQGTETILRGNVGLTVRVYGRNALGFQYVESRRHAHYTAFPNRYQSVGTFSIVYTLLSDTHFGVVGTRENETTGQRP